MRPTTPPILASLTLLATLTGCYNDPKNLDKAVATGTPNASSPTTVTTTKIEPTPETNPSEKKEEQKTETVSLSPDDLGLPGYPRAKPRKNLDGSERILPPMNGVMMLEQETMDTPPVVDAFYQANFLGATRSAVREKDKISYRYLLSGSTDKKERVVEITSDGKKTIITLAAMELALPKTGQPQAGGLPPASSNPPAVTTMPAPPAPTKTP